MSLKTLTALALIGLLFIVVLPGDQLIAQTKTKRVMAGVRFDGNTSVVSVVVQGGPADKAGIQVGDEILSADQRFVVQPADLMEALKDKREGHLTTLEVMRGGQIRFFQLQLITAVKGDVVIGEDGTPSDAPPKKGLLHEIGPELKVRQWYGIPDGVAANLNDNRGKVVCLFLFQSDCEFSLDRGLPELKAIQEEFSSDSDVIVLAIQTPFRNFEENTHATAIQLFKKLGLNGPLGHDGSVERRTVTFDAYKAYGTPWFIVLDPQGVVHYNDSSLPIDEARVLFESLKAKTTDKPVVSKPAQPSTNGDAPSTSRQ